LYRPNETSVSLMMCSWYYSGLSMQL